MYIDDLLSVVVGGYCSDTPGSHISALSAADLVNPAFVFPPIVGERQHVKQLLCALPSDPSLPCRFSEADDSTAVQSQVMDLLQQMSQLDTPVDLLSLRINIGTVFVIGSLQLQQRSSIDAVNVVASELVQQAVRGPAVVLPMTGQLSGSLHLRMRPELVTVSPGALSSDGVSHVNIVEDEDANRDLAVVSEMLFTRQVEEAAAALDDAADDIDVEDDCDRLGNSHIPLTSSPLNQSHGAMSPEELDEVGSLLSLPSTTVADTLKAKLHRFGVNMRYSGVVRRFCATPLAQECLLAECIARTVASTVAQSFHVMTTRAIAADVGDIDVSITVSDAERKKVVLSVFEELMGSSVGGGSAVPDFRILLASQFPSVVTCTPGNDAELRPDWLWTTCLSASTRKWTLLRSCELAGIKLSPKCCLVRPTTDVTYHRVRFSTEDIAGFVAVPKLPSISYVNEIIEQDTLDSVTLSMLGSDSRSMYGEPVQVARLSRLSMLESSLNLDDSDAASVAQTVADVTPPNEDAVLFQRAISSLQDELAVREGVLSADDERVVQCVRDLATLFMMRPSTIANAGPLLERVRACRPDDVSVLMDLAEVFVTAGDLSRANALTVVCERKVSEQVAAAAKQG